MTTADDCWRCFSCCLRQCRFRHVSAAAAAAVDPTASCQSARVYHSTPERPLIAASSAADAAAVAAGTTRPAGAGRRPAYHPSFRPRRHPIFPHCCSRLLADSAVDSAPLAVCRLVLWLIHSCRRVNGHHCSVIVCRLLQLTTICRRFLPFCHTIHVAVIRNC